jgi:hypothetical protein
MTMKVEKIKFDEFEAKPEIKPVSNVQVVFADLVKQAHEQISQKIDVSWHEQEIEDRGIWEIFSRDKTLYDLYELRLTVKVPIP